MAINLEKFDEDVREASTPMCMNLGTACNNAYKGLNSFVVGRAEDAEDIDRAFLIRIEARTDSVYHKGEILIKKLEGALLTYDEASSYNNKSKKRELYLDKETLKELIESFQKILKGDEELQKHIESKYLKTDTKEDDNNAESTK